MKCYAVITKWYWGKLFNDIEQCSGYSVMRKARLQIVLSDMIFLIVHINTYVYTHIHIFIFICRYTLTHRKRKEYMSQR